MLKSKLVKILTIVCSTLILLSGFAGVVSAAELDPTWNSNATYIPVLYDYEWETLTTVVRTQQKANYFVITVKAGEHTEDLFISFPAEGGFRLQSLHEVQKEQGLTAPEKSHAGLFEPASLAVIDYKNTGSGVMMKGTDGTSVTYTKRSDGGFRLQVGDSTNKKIVSIGSEQISYAYKDGVVVRTMVEMPLNEQEAIMTGSGFMNDTNQVGDSLSLTIVDQCADDEYAYIVVPIYHSNRGYSMWFNMTYYGQQDVGDTDPDKYFVTFDSEEGVNLDLYLWAGTPTENLQKYTALTGTSGVSPTWTYGFWMGSGGGGWRNTNTPKAGRSNDSFVNLYNVMEGYKERYGFYPEAVYVEGDNQSNTGALDYLSQKNIKPLAWWRSDESLQWMFERFSADVNPYPTVDANGKIVKHGYPAAYNTYLLENFGIYQFVADNDGKQWESTWDWTNPNAVTAMEHEFKTMWKWGLQGSMIDFGEWGLDYGTYSNGLTQWQMHNLMSYYYAKGAAEAFTKQWGGDYVAFLRSGTAGSQYYASNFLGDQSQNWNGYQMQIRGLINMGGAGYNLYGGDLGGYAGRRVGADLWNRWVVLSTFQPYMRQHGANLTIVWEDVGKLASKIFGNYYYFRKNIVPTVESAAIDANKTANPIVKGMLVAYPDQLPLKDIDDQYLFCDDFLVSAVIAENTFTKEVTLPKGATWYNLYTYNGYKGGQTITEEAPTSTMPVYVRSGAVKAINLPESMKLGAQMHDASGDEYEAISALLITPPDAKRTSTIHVKDGESTDYRTYESHTEVYTSTPGEGVSFTVTNEAGSPRQIVLALGVTAASVKVDGYTLTRLDHTPDYLNQEFGYVVDADGTTTVLLPVGWKELTIVKGDPNNDPLPLYGSMGGMDTMLDGIFTTNFRVTDDFALEFDAPTEIDRIVVKWAVGYYDSYDIEYSENGEDWYVLLPDAESTHTVEDGCGSFDDIRFGTVKAQYLRFVMSERGDAAVAPAIYELEAYAPVDLTAMTILPEEEDPGLEEDEPSEEWDDPYEEVTNEDVSADADGDSDQDEDTYPEDEEYDDEEDDEKKTGNSKKKRRRVVYGLPTWLIILLIGVGVLLLTGLILLLLFLKKKKKKAEEALAAADAAEVIADDGNDFPNLQ